ncbi:hypothetical protein HDA40_003755 [Hamadaea flava]|uniref:DUF262 domain-containing protein n=1 Tax=Hamadaea flava TaxID=1742688 RepID=A0ABV8LIX3_9ACTN|nr:DUF262 domain-containing protein [Hamadaea flava]MCP2325248.1 hypothetical protein [Hamadaea flava]
MSTYDLSTLVEGEHIPSHQLRRASTLGDVSDEHLNEKYIRGDVRIVVEQARYPLKQVSDLVKSADYDLQPDFQRRPRWSRERQSRLIESFIMNVPVPPVFLYETEYSRYEVMDGRQRLTAISDFYEGRFELEGLEHWAELNGRRYNTLPEQVRRGIDRRYLSSIVLLHETAKSPEQAARLKQLVFERINTGGEDLSSQEKRNALSPGELNKLCIRLARLPSLCQMWGIPTPTEDERLGDPNWQPPPELAENPLFKRMEDAELILRFFAHRQRRELWRSGTRLEEYLSTYLRIGNEFKQPTLAALEEVFVATSDLAFQVLGVSAFWLYRERKGAWSWVARPTLVSYDSFMWAFSRLLKKKDILLRRAKEIDGELANFYVSNYAKFDGRRVNTSDIEARDMAALAFLQSFCEV